MSGFHSKCRRPMRARSWKKVIAEDYSDLDPNKVVLSFRGDETMVNCIDKSLEEIVARRRKEAEEIAKRNSTSGDQSGHIH